MLLNHVYLLLTQQLMLLACARELAAYIKPSCAMLAIDWFGLQISLRCLPSCIVRFMCISAENLVWVLGYCTDGMHAIKLVAQQYKPVALLVSGCVHPIYRLVAGRVKTLHPNVHGGILARRDESGHMSAIQQHNIAPIDVVVVNLYPFRQTVTAAQAPSYETAVENIDIGGPAMIRAAAKNHSHVTVVVDPSDYDELLQQLGNSSSDAGLEFRKRSAWKAFQHCATYDSTVAEWFWSQIGERLSCYLPALLLSGAPSRGVAGAVYSCMSWWAAWHSI